MSSWRKKGAPEPIAALNRVPLRECGEPLVDIRKACPKVRVARKCIPFLRETVAQMVNRAQELLPPGYRLRVTTAYRTMEMQREHYERYYNQLREQHPEWSFATLRRMTNRFFAPVDQKAPPGHCTGGAVDVQLLLPNGKPADVTSPFTGWQAAPTWIEGLTPEAHRNRMILVEAMLEAGFSNCRDEFWHYSYGDAAWAVRVGASYCIYGIIELPPEWQRRVRK